MSFPSFLSLFSTLFLHPLPLLSHSSVDLFLSLSQLVVRLCRQRMSPSWKEVQPRSPVACRTMMDQSWSSRTPGGRPSSSTAHGVCICVHACLCGSTRSVCVYICMCSQPPFKHISDDSPTLTLDIFFSLLANGLTLPLKHLHIKKPDNHKVNFGDGFILCPNRFEKPRVMPPAESTVHPVMRSECIRAPLQSAALAITSF